MAPKNDQKSKPTLKRKNQLSTSGLMFSWVHGLQVGSKNRSQIDQKSITRWEGLPTSIFSRFWWILEAKLAPSWNQKSIKNRSKKAFKKRCEKECEKIRKIGIFSFSKNFGRGPIPPRTPRRTPPTDPPRDAFGGTGGLRPQRRRDVKTKRKRSESEWRKSEGESEMRKRERNESEVFTR